MTVATVQASRGRIAGGAGGLFGGGGRGALARSRGGGVARRAGAVGQGSRRCLVQPKAQQGPDRYPVDPPARSKTNRTFLPPFMKRKDGTTVTSRALTTILQTTTIPMGDYIPYPKTVMHLLDPRIKQMWLVALVVLPAISPVPIKVGMAGFVGGLSVVGLPRRVWKPQLRNLLFLSAFIYVFAAIGSDGVPLVSQSRAPTPDVDGLPGLPELESAYRYVLLSLGPIQVTQKGVKLAASLACLSFTILQSANLVLTTTSPEDLAASIAWYIRPLGRVGVPVDEVVLTLLLSLRFMSIVFEEIRNLALGVAARGVQTSQGGTSFLGGIDMISVLFSRLFSKLFSHADKISEAMTVRGFRSPGQHTIYQLKPLRFRGGDLLATMLLVVLAAAVVTSDVY